MLVTRWSADQTRRRGTIAAVVLVVGLAAAAVLPVLLCVRGWHEANTIRGAGPGRGTFTVAFCGDPQSGHDDHTTYTCTGTFVGHSAHSAYPAPGATAKVISESDLEAGVSRLATVTDDGAVSLASDDRAASKVAAWFTMACGVAAIEAAALALLVRRIRGGPAISMPDKPATWVLMVFGTTLCTWMLAFFVMQVSYRFW